MSETEEPKVRSFILKDGSTLILPLPCFVCGKQLDTVSPINLPTPSNQPYGGLMFDADGNYGSTVFDPSPNLSPMAPRYALEIIICDLCIISQPERVIVVKTMPQRSKYSIQRWNRDSEEY